MLEYALKYLKFGVSIIPVGKDKRPLLASWKEFQERKATEEEVRGWFEKYPDANIGIVTGKISGITVVDVDVKKGGSKDRFPQETAIVETGNKGFHLYYKYHAGMGNKAEVFQGVDIRGDGGYVVAPPSVTDYLNQEGKKEGGNYKAIVKLPYGEFPIHLFNTQPKEAFSVIKTIGTEKGSRNSTLASVIGKLIRNEPQEKWNTEVLEAVRAINQTYNPPLPDYELVTTFNSICSAEKTQRKVKGIPEPKPTSPALVKKYSLISLTDLVGESMVDLDATKSEDCISLGYEWLDDKITGLFPSELLVLGGSTGTGKTTMATRIIYNASQKQGVKCAILALEDRLLDYGIKAVYFELGRIRREKNLSHYPWNDYRKNTITDPDYKKYRAEAENRVKNDKVFFIKVEQMMDIDTLEVMLNDMTKDGFKLFLIDHLHYFEFSKGKDSKADYIENLMVRLKKCQNANGARIIMIVHYKKMNGKKPDDDAFKDSIAIAQNANYAMHLWRDKGGDDRYKTTISFSKSRNPNGEGSIEVVYDPEKNEYTCTDDDWKSLIKDAEEVKAKIEGRPVKPYVDDKW